METDQVMVLMTSGSWEIVKYVKILFFKDKKSAEDYCNEKKDGIRNAQFWTHYEIIKKNKIYEITRYANFED